VNEPSEGSEPGEARSRLAILIALLVVVALGALLAWRLKPPPGPAPSRSVEVTPDAGEARPAPPPVPAPSGSDRPRRRESRPEPHEPATAAEPPPPAAQPPILRVTSDVAGAFVFVDRKFLGKTPLQSHEVQAGAHRLQVSAEGYDGVTQSIEVAEAGPTDVSVSLKAVVVAARVPVVHKHRFGSCEGTLVADVRGLRYETSNRDDAWTLPFGDLENLSLDYQGKTLQIKQRGGRTWNFTTRTSNADPLLVFQREVDHARSRLTRKPE
jgi:PEGA domain